MTNSYPTGSSGLPDSTMPTGAPGFMPRRSSYASVVSGAASGHSYPRSGAFSNLLNPHIDSTFDPAYHIMNGQSRNDSRAYEMDFGGNSGSYGRTGSWTRGGQLPSFSSAYGSLVNGYGYAGIRSSADHFFVPSYLKGSKYVQRLEEAHKAKVSALKEGHSAHSSQPGSLSTSASSVNLHSKMAPSHRGITYDVIEKAPATDDESLPPLPSKWSIEDKHMGVEVLSDGQEVKFTGSKSDRDRDHEASAVRADHPMPSQCGIYYYEVTIVSRKREESSIGIGFSSKTVPLSRLPGWEPDSWAYHGDDGNSFACQSVGKQYSEPFTAGDVIGCGVNFRTGSAFFTKNGRHLGLAFRDINNKGKLYPSVGMKKTGEQIRVNFGQSPFVFDIDGVMSASNNFRSSTPSPSPSQQSSTINTDPNARISIEIDITPEPEDFPAPPSMNNGDPITSGSRNHATHNLLEPQEGSIGADYFSELAIPYHPTVESITQTFRSLLHPIPSPPLARERPMDQSSITLDRGNPLIRRQPLPPDEHPNASARTGVVLDGEDTAVRQRGLSIQDLVDYSQRSGNTVTVDVQGRRISLRRRGDVAPILPVHREDEDDENVQRRRTTPGWETHAYSDSRELTRRPLFRSRLLLDWESDARSDLRESPPATPPIPETPIIPLEFLTRRDEALEQMYSELRRDRIWEPHDPARNPGIQWIGTGLPQDFSLSKSPPKDILTMTDFEKQQEKAQIRQDIEASSTSKIAPPLSETDLIQSLVLQFLTHDGYVESAKAFADEVHAEKQALSLDPNAVVHGFDVKEDEDAGHRQKIRAAVLEGDIEQAMNVTDTYYPQVLKDNEPVYFRLKCRRFIELIRQGAEMQNAATTGSKKHNGHTGDWYDDGINRDMELDDHQSQANNWDRMDTEETSEHQEEYQRILNETLAYGQALQKEFHADPRREVSKALSDAFALMAYTDPLSAKGVSHQLDPSGRVAVAEELNSAILQSLGKSSSAALEQLYQQTSVLLEDLREGGGPGAFIHIDDFVRPKPGLS